ncbi:MAG: hypothetical protein SGILL_003455 [Bacillariaceae sp.]
MNENDNGEQNIGAAAADNVTPMAPPAAAISREPVPPPQDEIVKPGKKASGEDDTSSNKNINTPPPTNNPSLNVNSPSYQKVERPGGGGGDGGGSSDPLSADPEKTCRICLEDDSPETMIAPCKCKGSSKWVHRDCLDEWRLNERDRAFSQCTECTFEYYMQPIHNDESSKHHRWRQFRFCWNVSREVCMGTLLLQLVIIILGAIIMACDTSRALPNSVFTSFSNHPFSLYYLLGWLLLLVFVGIYGSIVLCMNGCDVRRSIPQVQPPVASQQGAATTTRQPGMMSGATDEDRFARDVGMESNTEFYRRARQRRQRRYRSHNRHRYGRDNSCCEDCVYGCSGQPVIIYDPGYNGCCCCHHHSHNMSGGGGDDCGCCNDCGFSGGGNNSNNDCGEAVQVLLVILLVAAVVLAAIGFVVGMVVAIIAFQRVVQRHIHLIQKRQLVQEYQVMDLQEYDLSQPLPTAPRAEDLEWGAAGSHPSATAPIEPLPERDVSYLQKLGLME